MSACILSPYGTYDSPDLCVTSEQCGYKWKCNASGVPELAPDGYKDTAEECVCYACTPDGCVVDTQGDGEYTTSAECASACSERIDRYNCTVNGPVLAFDGEKDSADECLYVCDGEGGRMVGDGVVYEDAKCMSCLYGGDGVNTELGALGDVHPGTTCTYKCEMSGDTSVPVFSTDADAKPRIHMCYLCDIENPDPNVSVPIEGTHGNAIPTTQCVYSCDGEGNKVYDYSGTQAADFECKDCTGGPEYVNVAAGETGPYSGIDECRYWCDDAGGVQTVTDLDRSEIPSQVASNSVNNAANVKCYTCGEEGCATVADKTTGTYSSMETCFDDEEAKCGWGYGCVDGNCALSHDATPLRSETECQLDSGDKCGWGYGCYTKFACVDGVACAAVPDAECDNFQCYDSATACMQNSTCNDVVSDAEPQETYVAANLSQTSVGGTAFAFTNTEAVLDSAGTGLIIRSLPSTEGTLGSKVSITPGIIDPDNSIRVTITQGTWTQGDIVGDLSTSGLVNIEGNLNINAASPELSTVVLSNGPFNTKLDAPDTYINFIPRTSSAGMARLSTNVCVSPLAGNWRIGNTVFQFTKAHLDRQGYRWYTSPNLIIGLKDTTSAMRTIHLKLSATDTPVLLASMDASNTDCFELDSIDLGALTGQPILLQRV